MTGFFSGAVMALQMSRALAQYGQVGKTGTLVSFTLVRELGPVLTALMVAGRNASGIASELGSMKVTEQIDAMRALGHRPHPEAGDAAPDRHRVMLPLLTVIADFVGMFGGFIIADLFLGLSPRQYWTSVWQALDWNDVSQGLLKPFVFAIVISMVGCFYGLRTTGGTQGVGRSTTQAVVAADVLIFILDLLITKIFVSQSVMMAENARIPILAVRPCHRRYSTASPVLSDISFEAFEGESRVILGAAGSGKTVLLKTALGLIKPDRGKVYAFGRDLTAADRARAFRDPQQDRDAVSGKRAVRFADHRRERGVSAAQPDFHPVPAGTGACRA